VAAHWGGDGRPNGWISKAPGLLCLPLIGVAVALLTGWIPKLDPRLRRDPEASGMSLEAIGVIRLASTALVSLGCLVTVAEGVGCRVNSTRVGINLILLFFLVVGNCIGRVRPNYFVGIRTPWTLESDEVWRATHRLLGRIWVFGALAFLALQFAMGPTLVMPCAVGYFVVASVLCVPYSYWRFRPPATSAPPDARS
jgi:uncharacterized membrane protein